MYLEFYERAPAKFTCIRGNNTTAFLNVGIVYAVYRPCCGYDTDLYVPSHRYGLNPPKKRIPEYRARLLPYHIRVGLTFKQLIYMNMKRKVKAKWGGAVSGHVTKAYGGSRSITPLILNIDVRWGEWSLPAPVTLLPVPSAEKMGAPQSQFGHLREQKGLLPLPGIEAQFPGCPARGLVTTPTSYPGRNISPWEWGYYGKFKQKNLMSSKTNPKLLITCN